MSRLMLAFALACLAVSALAGGGEAPLVNYDDGRLAVHADRVPVAAVLAEVARVAGASLRGNAPDREVSADLRDVPIEDVLERLLGKDNFALVYAADGRVRTIELLAEGSGLPSWPQPAGGVAGPEAEETPERQEDVLARRVAVTGRLAAALRNSDPTARQLINAALQQRSGRVRSEAQRRLLEAFDADPEIEDAYTRSFDTVDHPTLARMLRRMGPGHAEGFMAKLAAQARSEQLRLKAAALLELLRTPADDDAS